MIQVECPCCYFRFSYDDSSEAERSTAICNQCENRFAAEKFNKRCVLDAKNVRRSSVTATTLEIIGAIALIIAVIVLIGAGFKATLFSLQSAVSGIFIYSFGKLIRLVTEIRWFTKIQAERDFRNRQ